MVRLGDVANMFVLLNTGFFMGAVIGNSLGMWDLMSASFNKAGFCITRPDDKWTSSHAMCFYVDTVAALILVFLGRRYAEVPGIKNSTAAGAAAGTFAHGCAHLAYAHRLIGGTDPSDEVLPPFAPGAPPIDDLSALAASQVPKILLLWVFFWALLSSVPSVGSIHAGVHGGWASVVLALYVPQKFGFTFVQTVLLWVAAAYELMRPSDSKDRFYDLSALLVNVPVGVVSWAEGMLCELGFKAAGGHVWYDASIPLSIFLYYAAVLLISPATNTNAELRSKKD